MSKPSSPTKTSTETTAAPESTEAQPNYTKLAMRNMVRKPTTSLEHFFLSTVGLLAIFIALSYLTR